MQSTAGHFSAICYLAHGIGAQRAQELSNGSGGGVHPPSSLLGPLQLPAREKIIHTPRADRPRFSLHVGSQSEAGEANS